MVKKSSCVGETWIPIQCEYFENDCGVSQSELRTFTRYLFIYESVGSRWEDETAFLSSRQNSNAKTNDSTFLTAFQSSSAKRWPRMCHLVRKENLKASKQVSVIMGDASYVSGGWKLRMRGSTCERGKRDGQESDLGNSDNAHHHIRTLLYKDEDASIASYKYNNSSELWTS